MCKAGETSCAYIRQAYIYWTLNFFFTGNFLPLTYVKWKPNLRNEEKRMWKWWAAWGHLVGPQTLDCVFFTVTLSKNPTTAERVRGRRDAQVAADSCTSAADIVHLRLFITVGKQGSVTGIIYVPPVHAGLGKSALWCLFICFCFLKSLAVR